MNRLDTPETEPWPSVTQDQMLTAYLEDGVLYIPTTRKDHIVRVEIGGVVYTPITNPNHQE